jgi:hypothetical protein
VSLTGVRFGLELRLEPLEFGPFVPFGVFLSLPGRALFALLVRCDLGGIGNRMFDLVRQLGFTLVNLDA